MFYDNISWLGIYIMSEINTEYLNRCLETLKKSYEMIKSVPENSIEYEMYRNSLVKGFEITLEQSGKLLKKKLVPYFATKRVLICFLLKIFSEMQINIHY